jgi:amino acid adenylation domain-containing protein
LSTAERQRILVECNATAHPVECTTLPNLFEQQVVRTPDAVALVFENASLSYAQLNARANRLAHYLIEQGVGPDRVVAVALPRGMDLMVCLLAVIKSGAAYLPLDTDYPAERLAFMVADAQPLCTLTQRDIVAMLSDEAAPLCLDDAHRAGALERCSEANPQDRDRSCPLLTQHPAYVIYTSGSTGKPKGVINTHAGVVNRLQWMQATYGLDVTDCVLQKTPSSFDVSVWEFFWPLLEGARLLLARPEGQKDPAYLADVIDRHGVTTVHFVPSMLQVFLLEPSASQCKSLRRVICSGEALSRPLQAQFHRTLECELHNLYGPTEAAIDVTAWACLAADLSASVPIGRPIWNTQTYVLDAALRPVPLGVPGELYLAGEGLARGYLNRPGLTAERFIANPFDARGRRMYRTGDLARWRTDGALEYLGRTDHQVKLRGFRVELGEIEARILELPGVLETAVLLREDSPGDQRLVAYFCCADHVDTRAVDQEQIHPSVEAFQAHLRDSLPDHMIPAAYVRLQSLPLTLNGKLDRKALPAPKVDAYATKVFEAPQGEVEVSLAEIWATVLGVERVGRHDNFFKLGGHSLLAITLLERMRQRDLHAEVRALFATPTLAQLALAIGKKTPIVNVPQNLIPDVPNLDADQPNWEFTL